MSIEVNDEGLIEKAELVMAIREYDNIKRRRREGGIDIIVSPVGSDDKILMRVINKSRSKSGIVGIDAVTEMSEILERNDYDGGFLIGKRFTNAARKEMSREGIKGISEKFMPSFKPQKLYLRIQDYIDDLCKANCGQVPEKESDCKGYSEGTYSCKIRIISDNATFHFEHGWTSLLKNDLKRLLTVRSSMNKSK
jgi:hypothetical protein